MTQKGWDPNMGLYWIFKELFPIIEIKYENEGPIQMTLAEK